jgi:hypothetical protein
LNILQGIQDYCESKNIQKFSDLIGSLQKE